MNSKRTACLGAALSLTLAAVVPNSGLARSGNDARSTGADAAIAALIALGVGIAIAKHGHDHDTGAQWDDNRHGQPFSPSPHVTCLPKPRKCFERGHVSRPWTRRIFG